MFQMKFFTGRPTTTASATSRLESDKHLLGSNLSDDEFKILLEVVGTSHDGKISLSEFDKIVNYSLINPSNTSTHGHPNNTNNSSITNNHRYSDKNGSTASNSSNDYNNRNVKFDILDYEKFDKKNKIAWDKVREIRSSSAREHSFPDTTQIHNNTFDITATSHPHHQSTGRPHQVSRGRNLVPDKFTRRSHSLNGLGSPRTQDIRGLCKQGTKVVFSIMRQNYSSLPLFNFFLHILSNQLHYNVANNFNILFHRFCYSNGRF